MRRSARRYRSEHSARRLVDFTPRLQEDRVDEQCEVLSAIGDVATEMTQASLHVHVARLSDGTTRVVTARRQVRPRSKSIKKRRGLRRSG
jgi:hypothetical protein